jgi:hypothetical protein
MSSTIEIFSVMSRMALMLSPTAAPDCSASSADLRAEISVSEALLAFCSMLAAISIMDVDACAAAVACSVVPAETCEAALFI